MPVAENDAKRISLCGFQQLKRLSCSWDALEPNPSCNVNMWLSGEEEEEEEEASEEEVTAEEIDEFRLKDILPDSLEQLHIWGHLPDNEERRKSILENIEDAKNSLPNLKEVLLTKGWFECGWYEDAASELLKEIEYRFGPDDS